MAIYRFTVSCMGLYVSVFTFFTRRHIWSCKRCLELMYDLNDTISALRKSSDN